MIAGSSLWSHTFINVSNAEFFEAHSGQALGLAVTFEAVLNNSDPWHCRLSSAELKGMMEVPIESHTIVQVCMVWATWIAAWHAGLDLV